MGEENGHLASVCFGHVARQRRDGSIRPAALKEAHVRARLVGCMNYLVQVTIYIIY